MTHDEIEVIAAHRDGKAIQSRQADDPRWQDSPHPCWDFARREYRVKPEPRMIYVNEYGDGCQLVFNTDQFAREHGRPNAVRVAVPYREVVE